MFHVIKAEIRPTLKLAVPMIGTQLLGFGQQIIDTIMAGRHGALTLAGVSLAGQLFSLIFLLMIGISIGFSAQISQHHGHNDRMAIRRDFQQGIWLYLLLALLTTVSTGLMAYIPLLIGSASEIARESKHYLLTLAMPAGAYVFASLARGFFEGMQYPRAVNIAQAMLLPVNVLGNWFFLAHTHFGTIGMAISTGVCWLFYTFILFFMLARGKNWRAYRLFSTFVRVDKTRIINLVKIGFPIGVTIVMEVTMFSFIGIMASRHDAVTTAANQVAANYLGIMFMVPLGIASALTIRCANALGRNDWQAITHRAYTGIFLAGCFMLVAGMVIIIGKEKIVSIYTQDAEIMVIASKILLIIAFFEFVDGLQVAASGILRGLHDTRITLIYAFICFWLIGIPLGYILAYPVGVGIYGLWGGCAVGLSSFAFLTLRRVKYHINLHKDNIHA